MSVQVRPDWKPPKRKVDQHATRAARSGSGCRVCGRHGVTTHHLVPRSLGGDDVLANLVPLCGHGTAGCHGKVEAGDSETRSRLRAALTVAEIAYINRKMGHRFIDRYYPESAAPGVLRVLSMREAPGEGNESGTGAA